MVSWVTNCSYNGMIKDFGKEGSASVLLNAKDIGLEVTKSAPPGGAAVDRNGNLYVNCKLL